MLHWWDYIQQALFLLPGYLHVSVDWVVFGSNKADELSFWNRKVIGGTFRYVLKLPLYTYHIIVYLRYYYCI